MNTLSFTGVIFALIGAAGTVLAFVVTQGPRVERMRGVFGRLCVQLSPHSRAPYPAEQFSEFHHLINANTDALTAIDFLDDCRREDRSLLDRVGELSPSIFLPHIGLLIGLGLLMAVVIAPIVVGAAFAIPPLAGVISKIVDSGEVGSLPILLGVAAGVGVLFAGACVMFVWAVSFERHMTSLVVLVEGELLWSAGHSRRPGARKIVFPKDDLAFVNLKK